MGFESDKDLKQLLEHGCLFDKKISIVHQMASDLRPLAFNCFGGGDCCRGCASLQLNARDLKSEGI